MKALKKIIVLIITAMLIAISLILINTKASASDEQVFLKLERFRQPEFNTPGTAEALSYKSLNEKIMWKICATTGLNNPATSKYRTIYCIKAGPGFGSGTDMGGMDGDGVTKEYTKVFDLKNKTSIEDTYSKVLPSEDNYNALVWVLEHCYVPTSDPSKAQETKAFRDNLLAEAERVVKAEGTLDVNIVHSGITDNEIDIVQQLAVWYFTNNDEYKVDDECNFSLHVKNLTDSDYSAIGDKYRTNGDDRETAAQDLLYYFITEAKKAGAPTPSVTSSPVRLTSNNAKAIQYGTNYIIGPYTLTATQNVEYSLELSSIPGIKLLNSSKSDVTANGIKDLVGKGDFYISVPSSTNLSELKINITAKVNQTNLKYRAVAGAPVNEQPVVEVVREQNSFPLEVPVPSLSIFDLSLRKSITKLNETDTSSRLPSVNTNNLNNPDTTSKYNHAKNALQTDTNQFIEYTLTIFNEGQIDGYVKEIVDYLPAGIEFVEGIETNGKWQINKSNESEGKTKLTITNIQVPPTILNAYSGSGALSSIAIKLKCKVTAQRQTTQQVLTNIAEITQHSDRNGDTTIVDRDSQPGNFPDNDKNNSYEGNGSDGDYVKGKQDDDDFERVVLPAATGSFNIQLIKVDNVSSSKLAGAKFKVELLGVSNNVEQTYNNLTTNADGTVNVTDSIPIVAEGTYKYRITEEQAPTGYNKIIDTLTIEVTTKLQGNEYIVQNVRIVEGEVPNSTAQLDGKLIKVTIPNEKITGQFNLKLVKTDKDGSNKLAGAVFEVTMPDMTKQTVTTGNDGSISIQNIEIQGAQTYTYTIKEVQAPDGYEKMVDEIQIQVITEIKNGKYVVKSTSITTPNVDGIAIKVDDDTVELTFPNKKLESTYQLEIVKVDYSNNTLKLPGAVFEVTMPDKTVKTITVGDDGTASIPSIKISSSGTYTFIIKEVQAPKGYALSNETYTLTVRFALENGSYVIKDKTLTSSDTSSTNATLLSVGNKIQITIKNKQFDLSLRKFISQIGDIKYDRAPEVNTDNLNKVVDGSKVTTAEYVHPKDAIKVRKGDIITYTIRVYNEGEIDGYVSEVVDYIPEELEYIEDDELNLSYGWTYDESDVDEDGRVRRIKTDYTKQGGALDIKSEERPDGTLLNAYNGATKELDYIDLQVRCLVREEAKANKKITNIAEITGSTDSEGEEIEDRDSTEDSLTNDNSKPEDKNPDDNLPDDEHLPDYKEDEVESGKDYIPGQQDEDDFEKVIVEEFDLALRKFIVKINNEDVEPSREPEVDVSGLIDGSSTTAVKEHPKNPLKVHTKDIVLYTIRVYNEGDINGYVGEITDYLPEGLEFIENSEINAENGWKNPSGDGKTITTRKLENTLLMAFNGEELDYADVQVECKVVAKSASESLKNIAEITEHSDENGNKDIEDRDSTPDDLTDEQKENYNPEEPEKGKGYEDDDDFEDLVIEEKEFDLALRKFITAVDDKEVTDRIPQFEIDEEGNYVYKHTKEPVEVENGNIVTYTLRIYNEGEISGFAEQIKDDLPEGLLYLPENETNIEYRWKMIDENGEETENVEEAVSIVTDYLSKAQGEEAKRDNLLLAFDKETMEEPDHRDIKVAFLVTEPNTSDRILVNEAQISDDADEDGDDVDDKDSTPDEWNKGEDDQDREYVKVKYFDLSLRKWVTQAILIVDGKETVMDTGHKAEDDPEATVKVELVESKLSRTVLKFKYKIRITNEGEIAGSATEISDYIPKGLRFVQADNPQWKEVDGKVVTDQLKDVILQPGESTEVEIILTWINSKDNFGQMVNTAEISDDWNPSNTPDIDSTPNNEKPGEDDIDDAPVMPSIKTGSEPTYTVLILGSLIILGAGLVLIRKGIWGRFLNSGI